MLNRVINIFDISLIDCLSIPEWYAKKHVFITGATGFMGKVLVEKLIRCCPDIEKVYLLIRPKRGKSSKERLEEFLDTPVSSFL